MEQRDTPTRIADGARGLDVILDFDRHHLPAREAHEDRRRGHANRDHGVAEARPEERRERNGEDQKWHRQHRVGDAREQRIDPPAEIARDQPERHADRNCNRHRDDAGKQRGARAEDHARQHVTPDIVGAKPVQRGRRLAHRGPALRGRIVGRDQRREYRDQHE